MRQSTELRCKAHRLSGRGAGPSRNEFGGEEANVGLLAPLLDIGVLLNLASSSEVILSSASGMASLWGSSRETEMEESSKQNAEQGPPSPEKLSMSMVVSIGAAQL